MKIPNQTELHRHIDVSLRIETAWELAKKTGMIGESTSLQSFRDKIIISKPLGSLGEVLSTFELFQGLFSDESVFERVGFEASEDAYREGTRFMEFRFSPAFATAKSKIDWTKALGGFHQGIQKFSKAHPDFKAGLILISSREFGSEAAEKTIDLAIANRDKIIGVDLAGDETADASRAYEAPFARAKKAGIPITIHAGEGTTADAVWYAIENLGARRIGHGIASIQDPKLVEYLRKHSICLEICPISNWLTQSAKTWKDQPLPALLRAGVPVSINTDDPGFFGNTLQDEIRICQKELEMTQEEINACFDHAKRSSFL
ncbi:MAG: adenosine deaminase [Bdellovibrionales bacterium]|nr:adenosine deaminase [Bdellovibrionales bacterium]